MSKQVVWFHDYRIVPTSGAQQERAKYVIATDRIRLACDDVGVVATFTNDAGELDDYRWSWDAINTCVNVPRAGKK